MPDSHSLAPEQLRQLLQRLEEVMAEAERLREQVARQLSEQRRRVQQRLTPVRRKPRGKRR